MTFTLAIIAVVLSLAAFCISVLALKLSAEANQRAGWVERRTWNGGVGHLRPEKKERFDGLDRTP